MDFQEKQTDEELMREIRTGDEAAFLRLYRRRHAGIYQFALRMSGSRQVAEDVTQEVFMTMIRETQRYDSGRGSVVSYLYGIARNQVLRSLTRSRDSVSMSAAVCEERPSESLISTDNPLEELTRNETIETVRRAIIALPSHYREVVVLCDLNSLSYADAAAALECAVGTVRSRLHRAHLLLLEKLRGICETASLPEKLDAARCLI